MARILDIPMNTIIYSGNGSEKEVKAVRPDALILMEHYGDPAEWLQGDEWDSVMNYDAFMEPLTWFLTGMEKHSDERRMDLWGMRIILSRRWIILCRAC